MRKYCNILPKPTKDTINTPPPPPITKIDAETQTNTCSLSEINIQAAATTQTFGVQSCISNNILETMNHSSVGTQVKTPTVSTMMDFGSQVMLSSVCEQVPNSLSVGTQHDGPVYIETLENPPCFSTQTLLTLPTPPYLNTSETQTQDFSHVSLEDNEAQTLISILDMDPSCSTDCGTQTQRMFDEILSQTDDVELTESQTQTWLSSMIPQDPLMVNNVFGNRTTLEYLVNTETQTVMNDIGFDVGLINSETQTIPESFVHNC